MSKVEQIIENVNATMSMENMPLIEADKKRLKECLEGKISFDDAVATLVKKYMRV